MKKAGLFILTIVPLAAGWIAGVITKLFLLWKAAIIEGFMIGRQM